MDINDSLARCYAYQVVAIAAVLNHFGLPGQARREVTDRLQKVGVVRGADNWVYGATAFEGSRPNTNSS